MEEEKKNPLKEEKPNVTEEEHTENSEKEASSAELIEQEAVDSDFSDLHPYEATPKVEEEKKEEDQVVFLKEGEKNYEEYQKEYEAQQKEKSSAPAPTYKYENPYLEKMEASRLAFQSDYRKANRFKTPITIVSILLILAGWIVPSFIPGAGDYGWVVGLVVCVVCIAAIGVYVFFSNRRSKAAMDRYFKDFFGAYNAYTFEGKVTDLKSDLDTKLDPELFKEANLYTNVTKVTSRNYLTFNYKGRSVTYAEAAAQTVDKKINKTIYIGNFLVINNGYTGKDIAIYRKGNARALPPTNLKAFGEVFEDTADMVIYGPKNTKTILTKKIRDELAKFETNATFVDFSIAIRPGKTYFLLGYEDDLMVLPMQDAMNPKPYEQHKGDLEKVFTLIDLFSETLK